MIVTSKSEIASGGVHEQLIGARGTPRAAPGALVGDRSDLARPRNLFIRRRHERMLGKIEDRRRKLRVVTEMPATGGSGGPSASAGERKAISGVVERVVFHNPENGFAVLSVRLRGGYQPATVVGRLLAVSPEDTIRASGSWRRDPKHGIQFRAEQLAVSPPDSLDGIRRYLGSGKVKGVGPKMAKRLVKAFGKDVFEVIENEPERLKEVPGIGPKRAERLGEGFKDQKAVREIMVFLQTHGLGSARAAQIYRAYGADAILLIVAMLEPDELSSLRQLAERMWMQALVEVHDEAELEVALEVGAEIIGINNRDLRTFVTDLATTERLAGRVPPGKLVVGESGIHGREDLRRIAAAGAHAALIGESLVLAADPVAKLRSLLA